MLLYASGIIFFTFFYTSITFNPTETADNLRKYGGFVPGIRPGESTALYIQNISTKYFDWVPLPAPGGPNKIIFTYLPNFVFLINCSYWELINLVWICVTVSIATTTTIKIEAPPK